MAGKILEARLVIQGQDATGTAFKAIEKKMSDIGKSFDGAAKISNAVSKLRTSLNSASAGVDRMAEGFGTISLAVSKVERQVGILGRSIKSLGGIAKTAGVMIRRGTSVQGHRGA
jgi:hypothetical protein